jgi:acetyl-CoA synthetase
MPTSLRADIIRKSGGIKEPPPLLADYAAARAGFSWEEVARGLGTSLEGPLNLGELAVSRGGSLVWHGAGGERVRFTAAELGRASGGFAHLLGSLGIGRGDRVAFLSRSRPELFIGLLGALRFGAAVTVLGSQRSPDALANVLTRTAARAIVVDSEGKPVADAVRRLVRGLKTVVVVPKAGASVKRLPGDLLWGEGFGTEEFKAVPLPPKAPACIHYSDLGMSGAVAAHRAAFALASSAAFALDLRGGEGLITLVVPGDPLFVPYAVLAPLLVGATTYAFEDPIRFNRFDQFEDPVHVWYSSVKAIDVLLRNNPGLATLLGGCRHIAVTHPYDPAFLVMTEASYGSPLHPTWWPRELGAIQSAEYRSGDIRTDTIGRPLPGVEMAVDAESGRLAVRLGPGSPFAGYWDEPALTERRVKKGWFVTEQRARMDADGYAWIVA